jgi:hypothetical protein
MLWRMLVRSSLILPLTFVLLARPPLPPLPFEPDALGAATAQLEQTAWVQRTPDYAVRLRRVESAERREYLRRQAGAWVDPFASPDNGAERFLTFLIEVANHGANTLLLHCDGFRLVTSSRGAIITPIGLEALQSAYGLLGREVPEAYLKARPALLEGSRMLAPGESLSGLLVFSPVTARTKSFRVELHFILPNGEAVSMSAPYRRASAPRAGA